ncbi:serine hydrolase domain-containing protein [Roseateles sp.]|uniref:serine hydrolase domain-containing protein n=1 Tax=Roseateles sp. TaxID=1971397 RepID=UPI003BA79FF6
MHVHSKSPLSNLAPTLAQFLEKTYPADRPGATVVIAREGCILHRAAYGLADLQKGTPMSIDSVFRIGSLTKQFTAAAIMLLQERGQLAVQDTLHTHLPNYPKQGRGIRLAHLLNHTAGLVCFTDSEAFEAIEAQDLSHKQVLDLFQHAPLMAAPGAKFSYSNSGYFLLGLVIEAVSGTGLAQFFDENLFKPLNMRSTALEGFGDLWPIQGYTEEPDLQLAPPVSMAIPYAAGALVSTIDDMTRWENSIAQESLLPAAAWQQMWATTALPSGESNDYGYGFERRRLHDLDLIDHDGGISGFASYSARTADGSLFVCVLSNNDSGSPSTIDVGETLLQALANASD